MNNYEEVEAMKLGTVFQFENGAPWLRTDLGVRDLVPMFSDRNSSIPEMWKRYNYKLKILYSEG